MEDSGLSQPLTPSKPIAPAAEVIIVIRDTAVTFMQGCQKQPAAGKNRRLLGQFRLATLLGISLWMAYFKLNIPGLVAYFDNSAVYFKTFCQPCYVLWMSLSFFTYIVFIKG